MKLRALFDRKLLRFLLVGVCNTAFSTVIMFALYNLAGFGYWGSSAVSYLLGSILSFALNKTFTFGNRDSVVRTAVKFALNVAVCYAVAYSLAKPLVLLILSGAGLSQSLVEQAAMLVGMVLFTGLNYIGQRFFAFKNAGA